MTMDSDTVASVEALTAEVQQLTALVMELGTHLTALCHHPLNFEKRYNTSSGGPCTGCYDAVYGFETWLSQDEDKD